MNSNRSTETRKKTMCFDDGDFGSRENGDAAGIARLADGKEGCV
jgi:hypothetical protein